MMLVVAEALLLTTYGSDVVVCVHAGLVRSDAIAPVAVRLRLKTADSPGSSGVLRLHVIEPATGAEHVQSLLGVVIEPNVLPAGTSVVNVGFAAPTGPWFVTVCVNVNGVPWTTTAGTVFVIERSVWVDSVARVEVLAVLFVGFGSSMFEETAAVCSMIAPPGVPGSTVRASEYEAVAPMANVEFGVQVTTPVRNVHVHPGIVTEPNVVFEGIGIFSAPPSVVVTGLRP